MAKEKDLSTYLKEIAKITEWFDKQTEIDLEEAIKKVKEAKELIADSKEMLRDVENEFNEIEKEMGGLE